MRPRSLVLPLTLVYFVAAAGAQEVNLARASTDLSRDSLRRIGEAALQERAQKYGVETNPEYRRDVSLILTRLRAASGLQGPDLKWEIIRDSALNASAAPGSVMIVNVGLLQYCRAFTRGIADVGSRRTRYEGCVGAVLGHELAHLTLGHTDSVAAAIQRRTQINEHMHGVSTVAEALRDQVIAGGLAFERAQELEADRVGALYLLHGGWEVQDMMNLFRATDSVDRALGASRSLEMLTWLSDHPRGAEREARLDAFRGTLKLAQRDFDDALTLVNNGVMLDSAVVMLDRVLVLFPDLSAARHARAAALHVRWLKETPVRTRQLQGSVATYSKWFIPGIRGGDATLLNDARHAYEAALGKEQHPYTLSNLAVLDAYAGDFADAQQRADRAAQMKPGDPFVLNNRGVVLFLAGRHADAARVFETAMGAVSDSVANFVAPAILFNAGKTLAMLKDPRAASVLDQYLQADNNERSEWRREAIDLRAQVGGPRPAAAARPAATTNRTVAPAIAGVKLGDNRANVIKVLGQPDAVAEVKEGALWHYKSLGIAIGVDTSGGVAFIALLTPAAGSVDGVRVGDPVGAARAKWGTPSDVEQDAITFDRGTWVIHIVIEAGVITTIGIIAA
jgi:predicted Zn-dependent protease